VTKIFEKKYKVPADDVNFMDHVDNQIYLRWMNEVAIEHSDVCGWGLQDYANIGSGFVVKNHFIEYLAPTFEGEDLFFLSWISSMEKCRSTRGYRFFKLPNFTPFMKAETNWVYVDIEKGRPMDIPAEVKSSFQAVSDGFLSQRIKQLKSDI